LKYLPFLSSRWGVKCLCSASIVWLCSASAHWVVQDTQQHFKPCRYCLG
jgi:hypothetical protein